jgi:hypothetical protein
VNVDQAEGPYNSKPFTPTQPGTYRWVVKYSGDANNHPAGPTPCDAEPVEYPMRRPCRRHLRRHRPPWPIRR